MFFRTAAHLPSRSHPQQVLQSSWRQRSRRLQDGDDVQSSVGVVNCICKKRPHADCNGFATCHGIQLYTPVNAFLQIVATEKYISGLLYVVWRELITKKLHQNYFHKIKFYLINVLDHQVDNP